MRSVSAACCRWAALDCRAGASSPLQASAQRRREAAVAAGRAAGGGGGTARHPRLACRHLGQLRASCSLCLHSSRFTALG